MSREHVRVLTESVDNWPPIVIHNQTMQIIDGVHRVHAALLLGRESIKARFFFGTSAEAFIHAVQCNIEHGLPLTLAERTAAAERVMGLYPEWSDRRLAASVGLSPKTVAGIRSRVGKDHLNPDVRIGLDGRARRIPDHPRQEIGDPAASDNPDAAGGTGGGDDGRTGGEQVPLHPVPAPGRELGPMASAKYAEAIMALRKDPSLRFSESGRILLRLLDANLLPSQEWDRLAASIPPHRASQIVEAAYDCAQTWQAFAQRIKRRRPSA